MAFRDSNVEGRSEVRRRITRVVLAVGLAAYAMIAIAGDALPEWAKYLIFVVVGAVGIAADAWEIWAHDEAVDPNRWWRVGLLTLVAGVAVVWLFLRP